VGNLSYDATEQDLRQEFEAFGEVASVDIIIDKYSGQPKGFAFVEMTSKTEAESAITGLNGKTFKDRSIMVNESRPRTEHRGSAYGGNRSRGYGSSGYGKEKGGGFRERKRY